MAFQEVNAGNFKNLTKMAVGETFEAYVTKVIEVQIKGRPAKNLICVDDDGEQITVGASGNIKYMVDDGKLTLGIRTRFTRTPDKKVGSLNSSQFKVEQDPDDLLSDAQFATVETGTAPARVTKDDLAAAKIQREAFALTAQATAKRK